MKKVVLIIDDDKDMLMMIGQSLKLDGYLSKTALDGN